MMEDLGVQVAELDPEMTIVCSRAADFNPEHNVLWELDANKSAVRDDVRCFACGSTVAMSNDAYGKYQVFDKKPKACCLQCMTEMVQRGDLEP